MQKCSRYRKLHVGPVVSIGVRYPECYADYIMAGIATNTDSAGAGVIHIWDLIFYSLHRR